MEQQRLILWLALAFVFMLLWQAWMTDYATPPPPPQATAEAPSASAPSPLDDGLPPAARVPEDGDLPAPPGASIGPAFSPSTEAGQRIRVATDVLELDLGTTGAGLRRAVLRDYRISSTNEAPVTLLDDATASQLFVINSGVRGMDGEAEPTHRVEYATAALDYVLGDGEDELRVPFTWSAGDLRAHQDLHPASRQLHDRRRDGAQQRGQRAVARLALPADPPSVSEGEPIVHRR
jgi:YidC/Oxa1 family membrane protein insertase